MKNIRRQARRLFNIKKINKYDFKKIGIFKIRSQEVWDIASILTSSRCIDPTIKHIRQTCSALHILRDRHNLHEKFRAESPLADCLVVEVILVRSFISDTSVCAEKAMAPHSSVLAWRIPGTGEPGGLPSMGSHRVGHN